MFKMLKHKEEATVSRMPIISALASDEGCVAGELPVRRSAKPAIIRTSCMDTFV